MGLGAAPGNRTGNVGINATCANVYAHSSGMIRSDNSTKRDIVSAKHKGLANALFAYCSVPRRYIQCVGSRMDNGGRTLDYTMRHPAME